MLRAACVLGALLLGACASEQEGGRSFGCWTCGGQTGSLMPQCGVTPNAMSGGVPASAAGIVVSSEPCGDARLFDALTVRDASGQAIPFNVERLPNGEILIEPASGLTPGSYTVSAGGSADEDAGAEPDAGGSAPVLWQQTVDVRSSAPLPLRFGTVDREQADCSTILELTPDAAVLPYLGVLSVDLQLDGGAVQPLIVTGTMKLFDGVARVALPAALLAGLEEGEHTLRLVVQLAGESTPLEAFVLTLTSPCELSSRTSGDSSSDGCNALAAPGSEATWGWFGVALALVAARRAMARRKT